MWVCNLVIFLMAFSQKQLKEVMVYSGSQFEGTVHQNSNVIVAGIAGHSASTARKQKDEHW